jgi:hypothetical protein
VAVSLSVLVLAVISRRRPLSAKSRRIQVKGEFSNDLAYSDPHPRQRSGGGFCLPGLLLRVIAAVAPANAGDVTVDYMMDRSLGVVIGGGSIVGGIALLVVAG